MSPPSLSILVLAGGPDRERSVSEKSGQSVAAGLTRGGHTARVADIGPEHPEALTTARSDAPEVVFPALHGPWGEGGPLQALLEASGLPYVGAAPEAARRCMDKIEAKQALRSAGVPTAPFERVTEGSPTWAPPLVLKPPREGSSIDVWLCRTAEQVREAMEALRPRHETLLAERLIEGMEITVGVLDEADGPRALPALWVRPARGFYDFQAKYERDDTRYEFEIPISEAQRRALSEWAVVAHKALGCRDLSRVDFLVDEAGEAYVLEANTMPGFTDHSLLPMAAARDGLTMEGLVDHLVRRAAAREPGFFTEKSGL